MFRIEFHSDRVSSQSTQMHGQYRMLHIYSKMYADGEQLLYSKHVEDRLLEYIKKEKCILLVLIMQGLYHCNNGQKNVLHCYVIRTLSAFCFNNSHPRNNECSVSVLLYSFPNQPCISSRRKPKDGGRRRTLHCQSLSGQPCGTKYVNVQA